MSDAERQCMLYFNFFLILQHWLRSFSIAEYTALVELEVTKEIWLLWKKIKISKEVTSTFNMPITWLLWNDLIIMEWQWFVRLEKCTKVSTITRRVIKQSAKITVPWPEIMKGYKPRIGCVDPLDQKIAAYKLDRKSSGGCYYLTLFFDLMDISVVNLHNVYKV